MEQQTESCRIIISSGVLSCGLDPFTGDGWRRKRAPSIRSLRWHHVFISPRHDSAEPNESFKIFIVGVTHLPHTPASRTDDARAPVSAFSRWRPRQERLGLRLLQRRAATTSLRGLISLSLSTPEKSETKPSRTTSKY